MPFDGNSYVRSEAVARLDHTIHLLAPEERWVKRVLETDDGRRCIMGALRTANAERLEPFVCAAINELTGKPLNVAVFNDARETTYAMVIDALMRARRMIVEAEAATLEAILSPAGVPLRMPQSPIMWA